MTSLLILFAAAGAVPVPDFKTPIDYFDWWRKDIQGDFKPEDNAAPLLVKLFGDEPDDAAPVGEALSFCGPITNRDSHTRLEPWNPAQHPDWEAAWNATRQTRRDWCEAAGKPYALFKTNAPAKPGEQTTMLNLLLPQLSLQRACAKGVLENAWRAPAGKADPAELIAAARAALGSSNQHYRDPMILSSLVGHATRALAYDTLQSAVAAGVWSAADRKAVLKMLAEIDLPIPSFGSELRGEEATIYSILQAAAAPERGPISVDFLGDNPTAIAGCRAVIAKTDPPRVLEAAQRHFARIREISDKQHRPDSKDRMVAIRRDTAEADPLLKIFIAELSRAYEIRVRIVTQRRGTRLMYEILVYRDDKGRWPATLNDLPAQAIKESGIDPWSAAPFVYRVEGDRPTLYSVATNTKDDGGKHDATWGKVTPDFDFVFLPADQ